MSNTTHIGNEEITLGECIYSMNGHCAGPDYGMAYKAGDGQGYVAGHRAKDNEGLGLMGTKRFKTRRAAENFAVRSSDF